MRRRLPRGERGSAPLELALVFPVVAFVILVLFQGAMWYFAREVAEAAAQEGARTGAAYGSNAGAGVTQAKDFIRNSGNSSLLSAHVTAAGSTPAEIRIVVTGNSPSLIFFWPGPAITAVAAAPVERQTSGNSW